MSRLNTTMAALATMSPGQLRHAWTETFSTPVPPVPDSLLRRALAQSMQETTLGGLSAVARRSLEALASGGSAVQQDLAIIFKPGTRLMRQWNGRMHSVLVTADGFEFDGKTWKSLSAIAARITGAHWSGPRFFGLKRPQFPPMQVSRDGSQ
jgi:hypothetical protein